MKEECMLEENTNTSCHHSQFVGRLNDVIYVKMHSMQTIGKPLKVGDQIK